MTFPAIQAALAGEEVTAASHVILSGTAERKPRNSRGVKKLFIGSKGNFVASRGMPGFVKAVAPKSQIVFEGTAHRQELLKKPNRSGTLIEIQHFFGFS